MLCEKNNRYDSYIFIRPDLKYIKKIDINQVLESVQNPKNIYTPMKIYANRLDYVHNYIKSSPLHGERFLKYIADSNNLVDKEFKMIGLRIRCNGVMAKGDQELLRFLERD